jgi:hypothetical protein
MECIRDNWRDIARYFQDTWVKLEGYGDTLFHIDHVNELRMAGHTQDNDYFEIELHNHQPFQLNYALPHKAVFQYNKRAVILQRTPAKQFKRGLSSENVTVSFTDSGACLDLDLSVLKAYTSKQNYRSFGEAFSKKGTKDLSVALTPRMSCVRSTGRIFMDTTHIGDYNRETNTITLGIKKFLPEVRSHVEKHQDKIEVN